jgi:pre-mRNA-processing factor SLU7
MSQYTVPKKKNPLDGADGFSAVSDQAAANPHIPKFVATVPWYLRQDAAAEPAAGSLEHQKTTKTQQQLEKSDLSVSKGSIGDVKTRFVKGVCENCGSTSHKRRDCLERPRKVIAKFSGEKLASNDLSVVDRDRSSFEAKRDRWRGFVPDNAVEERPLADGTRVGATSSRSLLLSEEETFSTVTSLRSREDTVKYLLNMDKESSYYDPKSRSLRDTAGFEKAADESQAEAAMLRKRFAWEASQGVSEVANPTAASRTVRAEQLQRQKLVEERKAELEKRYASGPSR